MYLPTDKKKLEAVSVAETDNFETMQVKIPQELKEHMDNADLTKSYKTKYLMPGIKGQYSFFLVLHIVPEKILRVNEKLSIAIKALEEVGEEMGIVEAILPKPRDTLYPVPIGLWDSIDVAERDTLPYELHVPCQILRMWYAQEETQCFLEEAAKQVEVPTIN